MYESVMAGTLAENYPVPYSGKKNFWAFGALSAQGYNKKSEFFCFRVKHHQYTFYFKIFFDE
jgi:hypothetical protein